MFGSVVLDVVIGLVFIYLLYSLLASIISELIATFLGLRARNLKQGIARMLENDPERRNGYFFNNKLTLFFTNSWRGIAEFFVPKKGVVLDQFYKQPNIKYLAAGKYFSKPSYISAANFSKAIFDMLKNQGDDGNTDLDKVKNALLGAAGTKDQLNSINRLLEDPKGDDAQKVEGIRILLEHYAVSSSIIHGETREHIVSLLNDAQNDLVKFKGLLERWFDDTMERVTGWYKRTTQLLLLIIGLGLAIIFNANTIEIVNILSTDKDAREQMVQMASAYVKENQELIDLYRKDNAGSNSKKEFNSQLDSLLKIKNELESDIEGVNKVMGFQPADSLPVTLVDSASKITVTERQSLLDEKYLLEFSNAYLAERTSGYYQIVETEDQQAVKYAEFKRWKYIRDNFWGYLLTALAISLGAPFWFDLLNKLVKMRGSVQQSTQKPSPK